MKHILFVDDDPAILSGLRRMLHAMRAQWEMSFAESGPAALALLVTQPVDVVVSDMRMPGMDGVKLLEEVKRLYPGALRIILSGHADQELTLRSTGPAHQFLSKPCNPEVLKSTIERACSLHGRMVSPELKLLAARLGTLPSVPTLYAEILAEIRSPTSSLTSIGGIISRDMAMTAKVLQLVNSAFFGVRQQICDPALAASFLGLETIKALVLSVQVFSRYEGDPRHERAIRDLWDASTRVGAFARTIARAEHADDTVVDQAFFGGMLHDIGTLLLLSDASNSNEVAPRLALSPEQRGMEALERASFGGAHADLGAYLLGIWGLPGPIIEAVAFHHDPAQLDSAAVVPLTYVHAAAGLATELHGGGECTQLDEAYLARLGLLGRLPRWRELCGQADAGMAAA